MVPIAIQRGSSNQETITIDFAIDDEQYTIASKWNNRNDTTEYVSDLIAVSHAHVLKGRE